MPPAKDMGTEGGSQLDPFQWGNTSIADWRQSGYGTTYDDYGAGFSRHTDLRAGVRGQLREATPWSTTNNQYGKGMSSTYDHRLAKSLHGGSVTGSLASVSTYRSHPALSKWRQDFYTQSLTENRPHASLQLEQRLWRRTQEDAPSDAASLLESTAGGTEWTLPKLDPSKYLVAHGPGTGWQERKPASTGRKSPTQTANKGTASSRPDVVIPSLLTASQEHAQAHAEPPKTGPAKRYMRDTLERFLRSIPEDLRPKTRKQEPPQILKVEHGLPERMTTCVSHAVPSTCSSSGSSWASDDGVIDLNDSAYDIRKELNPN